MGRINMDRFKAASEKLKKNMKIKTEDSKEVLEEIKEETHIQKKASISR